MGAEMTVDHFLPRTHGGDDHPDNLVYCCHACNEFKSDNWSPEPDLRLLHPLRDDLTHHYREQEDGTLVSHTERGANHLQILRLNRPELIAYRLEQNAIAMSRQLNQMLRRQLQEAHQAIVQLETELARGSDGS